MTMVLSDHERHRFEKPVKAYVDSRRPPPHVRPELDIGYRIDCQSIEIFELRPAYRSPEETIEHAIAKATYIKSRNVWKIYWMRADLQWHPYGPMAIVQTVEEFIAVIDQDQHGCFFG